MRSAVLTEPNRIELQEKPKPEPGEGEVLIRVRAVGVCGSDTHYFAGSRDHESSTVYPFVLGHEFAGEVARLGPGVSDVKVGTRALCSPDLPCGSCRWCSIGRENVCPNVKFAGSAGVHGCLSEYYIVQASQLHPIPDSMSFEEATLAEPLAIGLHNVDNLLNLEGGESCAVIGAGPIGLVSGFCARLRDAGPVYVSDRYDARLEAALRCGADEVCKIEDNEKFVDFIDGKTDGEGADVVIEAGGEQGSITQAPHLARIRGLVLIEGIPPEGQAPFAVDAARRRELTVIFGRRSLHKADEALELIGSGQFDAEGLITHRYPLEETQKALECCRDYSDGVIKAVIFP